MVVSRALLRPVRSYALRKEDFITLLAGMEMDAEADIQAPALATLDLYCARVASAVGHLSVHIFGDPSDAAHAVAEALGRALQLTNILRDLAEDAARHRLYLPREILDRHGIRIAEPEAVLRHPALPAACRDLVSIAEVVRDLFRPDDAPEQSYSERQIFEAASTRLARELGAMEQIDEKAALEKLLDILNKASVLHLKVRIEA